MNKRAHESGENVLDDAARAGWLYYVGGLTQDQIATELGVSRQRAQRLVARAMSEGLVHVRLEHPIAHCMSLEAKLRRHYDVELVRVAPSLGNGEATRAIAPFAASLLEQFLRGADPLVIALGTGRSLRAMVEELTEMDCEHHKLVSLVGNIAPDGTATNYDVIMRIADKVRAPHYPMPLPVIVDSAELRTALHLLPQMQIVAGLVARADVTFVGVGQMSDTAPLFVDGFITADELAEQQSQGAVGEIASSSFDGEGRYIETALSRRIGGLRASGKSDGMVIGVAGGRDKVAPLRAALNGKLINALVTDEDTAALLLH